MMKTNELINILIKTPQAKKPWSFGVVVFLGVGLCAIATLIFLGLRDDALAGIIKWSCVYKTVTLASLLSIATLALHRASKPFVTKNSMNKISFILFGLFIAGCVMIEWASGSPSKIIARFGLPNFDACLISVLIYGTLGAVILTVLMRRYAPSNEKWAATLIGLTAASMGALGYSIHCPVDSPTFIVVSYGLPIAIVAVGTRLFSIRFIKW